MNLTGDFIFSQSSLQDYTDCPRRFQLRYLQRVRWPAVQAEPVLEHEQRLRRGQRFHHLVHQHILGIPAGALERSIGDDTDIRRWWQAYLDRGLAGVPENRYPELTLTAPLADYRLMAKYDLLAVEPGGRALIVDWKTAPASSPQRLERRLQTAVYRCVLALAGADVNDGQPISPERIEMIYWFADGQPVTLPYDDAQLRRDQTDLLAWADEINRRDTFPLTPDVRHCRFCAYRSLCDRGGAAGDLAALDAGELDDEAAAPPDDLTFDLDQIAEVEF